MTQPHLPRPTRYLPDRPSLAQLRKQAKELLKSYRAGEPEAVAEVSQFELHSDPATFALADAQRVVARAYGFTSWTELKRLVESTIGEAFCQAADSGDIATVRRLAKARPEIVNQPRGGDFGERIALHFAVLNHDVEMIRVLMELGADARRSFWPYRDGTASSYALAKDRGYDDIVAIIEQEEARRQQEISSPDATIDSRIDDVAKAILEGRDNDARQMLESDLSLVGACTNYGATPLHLAAWKHNPQMVRWLLEHQASVDAENPYADRPISYPASAGLGRTPLDYAATVAGWPASDNYFGWSATNDRFPYLENAHVAPELFQETVRLLRSHGAKLTPRAAVATGDTQTVAQMHQEGRLVNEIQTVRGGLLAIAVRADCISMVSQLLDLGFDPDEPATTSEDGAKSWGFPLWFAAICGRYEIAELLLARGADVNAIVLASGDALCQANATRGAKMRELLLSHGARFTVENLPHDTTIETIKGILDGTVAAQSLNVENASPTQLAEQLLWASASSNPEFVRMCLPHLTRAADDPWWGYVLTHATLPESFKLIVDHGIDPNVADNDGATPLHNIAMNSASANEKVAEEQRVVFANALLDAGASLDRRESLFQSTPLGWACRWGRIELVKLYLQRGVDAIEPDAEPWATPLAWATKYEHRAIVELLQTHGS